MAGTEKLKILIIYGYHSKEIFATETGRCLARDVPIADIKVVEYEGKADRGVSSYYLRKFVEKFNPLISPIVLHGDDDMDTDVAIIYNAKSKQERRASYKPLQEFCVDRSNRGNDLIVWGGFLTRNTNYGVIDIELNSRMDLGKATAMVKDFSQYLLNLYSDKKIKL